MRKKYTNRRLLQVAKIGARAVITFVRPPAHLMLHMFPALYQILMYGSCNFDRSLNIEIGVEFYIFVYCLLFCHVNKIRNHCASFLMKSCNLFEMNFQNNKNHSIIQHQFQHSTTCPNKSIINAQCICFIFLVSSSLQ